MAQGLFRRVAEAGLPCGSESSPRGIAEELSIGLSLGWGIAMRGVRKFRNRQPADGLVHSQDALL